MALSTGQKIGWGMADMGITTFVIVKQLLVFSFLTNFLGIDVIVAGWVTSCILVFDLVTDPIIGSMSDRTNSPLGRRAPWMLTGAVVMVGSMIAMFAIPREFDEITIIIWVALTFGLATIGFTMCAVPYSAMAGEITESAKERSSLTGWRAIFASIGILIGGGLWDYIANGTREGHFYAAIWVGCIMVASIWLSVLFTRNTPKKFSPSEVDMVSMAKYVFSNWAFMILTVLFGFITLAISILMAGAPFAATYIVQNEIPSALSPYAESFGILPMMFGPFILGTIVSQPLWVAVSDAFGKTIALIIGLGFYIIMLNIVFNSSPFIDITKVAGLFFLTGIGNGTYHQIPWAMYPDLMDVTRKKTGAAIEGAFSSVWYLGQKIANAFGPFVLSLVLGIYGFQETTTGSTAQTQEALDALIWGMTILPATIFGMTIIGLIFIYFPFAQRVLKQA